MEYEKYQEIGVIGVPLTPKKVMGETTLKHYVYCHKYLFCFFDTILWSINIGDHQTKKESGI